MSTLVVMLGSIRILSSCWVFASDCQKLVIRNFGVSQTNVMQGAASYCEPAFRLVWPNCESNNCASQTVPYYGIRARSLL